MAVPSDRNTSVKVTEKLSKYKDLEIETSRMWGMRTETIPVIIGGTGSYQKRTRNVSWKNPRPYKHQ